MNLVELNDLLKEFDMTMAVKGTDVNITDVTGFALTLPHSELCCIAEEDVRLTLEEAYANYFAEQGEALGTVNPTEDLEFFQQGGGSNS